VWSLSLDIFVLARFESVSVAVLVFSTKFRVFAWRKNISRQKKIEDKYNYLKHERTRTTRDDDDDDDDDDDEFCSRVEICSLFPKAQTPKSGDVVSQRATGLRESRCRRRRRFHDIVDEKKNDDGYHRRVRVDDAQ
jgi:hypothetical protein